MIQTCLKPDSVFAVVGIEQLRLLLGLISGWYAVSGGSIHIDVFSMVIAVISTALPYLLSRATLSDE